MKAAYFWAGYYVGLAAALAAVAFGHFYMWSWLDRHFTP